MRVKIVTGNYWLTSSSAAAGEIPVSRTLGLAINHGDVVDEFAFLRAVRSRAEKRSQEENTVTFGVNRLFDAFAQAMNWALAYESEHVFASDVEFHLDQAGASGAFTLKNAFIAPPVITPNGATLRLDYTISGGQFEAVTAPFGYPFNQLSVDTSGGAATPAAVFAGQEWPPHASLGTVDGIGGAAKFYIPNGMCIGADGFLYVSEFGAEPNTINHPFTLSIPPSWETWEDAGYTGEGGIEEWADFAYPSQSLYGNCIRKVDRTTAQVTTFVGRPALHGNFADGNSSVARFHGLVALFPTTTGLLVADYLNSKIRFVTYAGVTSTVAGNGLRGMVDGPAASASFAGPNGVCMSPSGIIYVAEYQSEAVRKIGTDPSRTVSTITTGIGEITNLLCLDEETLIIVAIGGIWKIENLTTTPALSQIYAPPQAYNMNGIALGHGVLYCVSAGPNGSPVSDRVLVFDLETEEVSALPAGGHYGLASVAFDGTSLFIGEAWGSVVSKMKPG